MVRTELAAGRVGEELVSVIMPVYNAGEFLAEALQSVMDQTYRPLQLSVYNDGSQDNSMAILESFSGPLAQAGVDLVLSVGVGAPKGCGYACNRAIEQSSGPYLCFLDADDVMAPTRVAQQLVIARDPGTCPTLHGPHSQPSAVIVGCNLSRLPETATPRYVAWLNRLERDTLFSQRFRECTLAKPTWFMHRTVFNKVGGFDEGGRGVPEDLIFFYRHIELGGGLAKVPRILLQYRRHDGAQSLGVPASTIWALRLNALQQQVLSQWPTFGIWGAGRDGRHLYRDLPEEMRSKVTAFYDVDAKKIAIGHYYHHETGRRIPVKHYSEATGPIVTCVKLDLHAGFEDNLAQLGLVEGQDFFYFC